MGLTITYLGCLLNNNLKCQSHYVILHWGVQIWPKFFWWAVKELHQYHRYFPMRVFVTLLLSWSDWDQVLNYGSFWINSSDTFCNLSQVVGYLVSSVSAASLMLSQPAHRCAGTLWSGTDCRQETIEIHHGWKSPLPAESPGEGFHWPWNWLRSLQAPQKAWVHVFGPLKKNKKLF